MHRLAEVSQSTGSARFSHNPATLLKPVVKCSMLTKPLRSLGPDNWVWRFPKQSVYSPLGLWPELQASSTVPPISAQPSSLTLPPWENGCHQEPGLASGKNTATPPCHLGGSKSRKVPSTEISKRHHSETLEKLEPRNLVDITPAFFSQPTPSFAHHQAHTSWSLYPSWPWHQL